MEVVHNKQRKLVESGRVEKNHLRNLRELVQVFVQIISALRVYGESAHLHLKFAQNFAVKLAAEFCNLLPTPKYLWKWMPKSMRDKFVITFN